MNHPKYRPDIDGLRAIAVIGVVGFHAFPAYISGGFIGVDIFFVISGYLISTILYSNLAGDKFSFTEFYVRRAKRIFPALLLVLLTFYVVGWYTLFPDEFKQFGKHILSGALFVSNFTLLSETGYFDVAAETKPLLHLWSLAIEEQYYIVWPLMVVALWKRPKLFPWAIGLLFLVSFVFNVIIVQHDPSKAFYLPLSRFWELLSGGILAFLVFKKWRTTTPKLLQNKVIADSYATLGLLLLVIPQFVLDREMPFPGWLALLPVAGTWIIIQAGAEALPNKWILSNKWVIWFGLISYPLYLWHWPLLSFARTYGIGEEETTTRLILVGASILLAWLTYKLVERPVRFGQRQRYSGRILASLMALIGITGFITMDQGGVPSRSFNSHNLQANYDWPNWYRFKKCFIETKDGYQAFSSSCDTLNQEHVERPLVMLWGDSHAASIFPGLRAQAEQSGFDIAQYTANGCPPVQGFQAHKKEPNCPAINSFVLNKVKELKPELIILSAYWINYNGKGDWNQLKPEMIQESIASLTSQGFRVIVFDQLPVTDIAQPHVAARLFKENEILRTISHFLDTSLGNGVSLQEIVHSAGAEYFSPKEVLCNDGGCLISTSPDTLLPVAWDYGHLTQDGSVMLINKAINEHKLVLVGSQPED